MACHDPECLEPGEAGDFFCRECGEMVHAECTCSCFRVTCPECGHTFHRGAGDG